MNKDNKKFIVETLFLKETLKQNISLKEFLVLMYFDNEYELTFDVKKVSKATCLSEEDVLVSFQNLLDKKLITLNSIKNESGKLIDKVSLENLYKGITNDSNQEKAEKDRQDFLTKFQQEYKRGLSSMDFEIINAWLSNGFSEDLILGALETANYNGATSLRYIDTVLYSWKKKGFNSMEDVNNHMQNKDDEDDESNKIEDAILEYNWLDED